MAGNVRQYVGARYVPKFHSNSTSPSEITWEANTAYEALTVVGYNGSSYTSKIPVPSGIGNPADNPTYWALTGNYNGQVELYRQETVEAVETANNVQSNLNTEIGDREKADETINQSITTTNNLIDAINFYKDKDVLILGDSLSDTSLTGSGANWVTYFTSKVEACGGSVTNYSVSGRSLTAIRTNNIIANLNNIPSGTYDIILVWLGINDWQSSATRDQIFEAMTSLRTWFNSNQPNAIIYFGTPEKAVKSFNASIPLDYYRGVIATYALYYGFIVCDTFGELPNVNGNNTDMAALWQTDGLHFKESYGPILADYWFNRLRSPVSSVLTMFSTSTPLTDITNFSSVVSLYYHSNGLITIGSNAGTLSLTDSQAALICTLPEWARPVLNQAIPLYIEGSVGTNVGVFVIRTDGTCYAVGLVQGTYNNVTISGTYPSYTYELAEI